VVSADGRASGDAAARRPRWRRSASRRSSAGRGRVEEVRPVVVLQSGGGRLVEMGTVRPVPREKSRAPEL
jgi:hypothetical protein